jgi:hypothetical protein
MSTTSTSASKSKKSRSKESEGRKLITFAISICEPVKGEDGRHYVSFNDTPHIAVPHASKNSDACDQVSNRWFHHNGEWPTATAKAMLADYLTVQCKDEKARAVNLRASTYGGNIYLDTAWSKNEVIEITPTGVNVLHTAPVLFARSGVTSPLPSIAEQTLDITALLKFIRISKDALPALISCLLIGWMVKVPQPIVFFQGSAKSGKTSALRILLDLVDPTTAYPGATLTNSPKEIKAMASMRRTFVFDNVSYVDADDSDLLARISTGGEIILRAHYTNDEAHTTSIMRPVLINGIMDGFNRGDLSSRAVTFELQTLGAYDIESRDVLDAEWAVKKPLLFATLLQLCSHVLSDLVSDTEKHVTLHRNQELAKVTRLVSKRIGIEGSAYIEESVGKLSEVVLGSSVFGESMAAIAECMNANPHGCSHDYEYAQGNLQQSQITGKKLNSNQLHEIIVNHTPEAKVRDLPDTAKKRGEALKRTEADLLVVHGVQVIKGHDNKGTYYQFELADK